MKRTGVAMLSFEWLFIFITNTGGAWALPTLFELSHAWAIGIAVVMTLALLGGGKAPLGMVTARDPRSKALPVPSLAAGVLWWWMLAPL